MRVLRIYLKHHNGLYVDMPLPDGVGLDLVLNNFKIDGVLSNLTAVVPIAVPYDGWSFMAVITVAALTPPNWVMSPEQKPN